MQQSDPKVILAICFAHNVCRATTYGWAVRKNVQIYLVWFSNWSRCHLESSDILETYYIPGTKYRGVTLPFAAITTNFRCHLIDTTPCIGQDSSRSQHILINTVSGTQAHSLSNRNSFFWNLISGPRWCAVWSTSFEWSRKPQSKREGNFRNLFCSTCS